jgi:hypothetical protein
MGKPREVGVLEAAELQMAHQGAVFEFVGRRVYSKPMVGIFAYWPGASSRRGDTAEETQVHRVAKEALERLFTRGVELKIQPLARYGRLVGDPIALCAVRWRVEAPIRHKGPRSRLQPDILVFAEGGELGFWIAIEVRNTHAVNYRKRRLLQGLSITTLEIDVRGYLGNYMSDDDLRAFIGERLAFEVQARVLTKVSEEYSRAADDDILAAAIATT